MIESILCKAKKRSILFQVARDSQIKRVKSTKEVLNRPGAISREADNNVEKQDNLLTFTNENDHDKQYECLSSANTDPAERHMSFTSIPTVLRNESLCQSKHAPKMKSA